MNYDDMLYKTTKKAIDDLGQPIGKTKLYDQYTNFDYNMRALVKYKRQAVQSNDYIVQLNDQYTFTMLEPININWFIGWNNAIYKVKSIDNSIKGIYTMYCDCEGVAEKHTYTITIDNEKPINTKVGQVSTINCTCVADGLIDQDPNITYKADNDNVTIEGNKVTSIKEGSSIITCTYYNVNATIKVNISKADEYAIQCDNVTIDKDATYQLKPICTINGIQVQNQSINYSVKDSSIAKVSTNGIITGLNAGNTTITLTWNGASTTINCTINEVIINYTIEGVDEFKHMTSAVFTLNPSNPKCVWSIDEISAELELCEITSQDGRSCTIYGNQVYSSEFFTLYAKIGDTILAQKDITIKKRM